MSRYREPIAYLICGIVTTLVNYAVYFSLTALPHIHYAAANAAAWAVSVTAAYVMNKAVVFQSKDWSPGIVARELGMMACARLATLGLETAILWLAIDMAGLGEAAVQMGALALSGETAAKLVAGIVVTATNYFASKFWIFTKK